MKSIRTNSSYNHSHQKTHKSLAKHLTRSSVPDTIFSDKATKRQSDKATKRHKRAVCPHNNTPATVQFFSKQPWFGKGGVPLKPPAFLCFKGVFPLKNPPSVRGAFFFLPRKEISTPMTPKKEKYGLGVPPLRTPAENVHPSASSLPCGKHRTVKYRGFQRGIPFGSAGKRGGYRGRKNPALT